MASIFNRATGHLRDSRHFHSTDPDYEISSIYVGSDTASVLQYSSSMLAATGGASTSAGNAIGMFNTQLMISGILNFFKGLKLRKTAVKTNDVAGKRLAEFQMIRAVAETTNGVASPAAKGFSIFGACLKSVSGLGTAAKTAASVGKVFGKVSGVISIIYYTFASLPHVYKAGSAFNICFELFNARDKELALLKIYRDFPLELKRCAPEVYEKLHKYDYEISTPSLQELIEAKKSNTQWLRGVDLKALVKTTKKKSLSVALMSSLVVAVFTIAVAVTILGIISTGPISIAAVIIGFVVTAGMIGLDGKDLIDGLKKATKIGKKELQSNIIQIAITAAVTAIAVAVTFPFSAPLAIAALAIGLIMIAMSAGSIIYLKVKEGRVTKQLDEYEKEFADLFLYLDALFSADSTFPSLDFTKIIEESSYQLLLASLLEKLNSDKSLISNNVKNELLKMFKIYIKELNRKREKRDVSEFTKNEKKFLESLKMIANAYKKEDKAFEELSTLIANTLESEGLLKAYLKDKKNKISVLNTSEEVEALLKNFEEDQYKTFKGKKIKEAVLRYTFEKQLKEKKQQIDEKVRLKQEKLDLEESIYNRRLQEKESKRVSYEIWAPKKIAENALAKAKKQAIEESKQASKLEKMLKDAME